MHRNILKKEQIELLPLIKIFNKDFYLAGGTAIALHIGHRYSLDFDLFTSGDIKRKGLKMLIAKHNYKIEQVIFEDSIQFHCIKQKMSNNLPTAALSTTTLIIRSAGERTVELCKKLILEQGVPEAQVFVVQEVPFSAVMRKSFEIGISEGRKWTFCVDADVLLRPTASLYRKQPIVRY